MINKSDSYKNSKVFLSGAIIGAVIFLVIYGFDILNVTNDSLIFSGYIEKDIAQHYAGWMLFRDSPWQFPLGVGQNIAYPYGSAVSYTDSIPLFAIFFKLFRNILPETFQYFGIFVLMCFMLQGAFGGLLSTLFTDKYIFNILSSVLFAFTPVMIERAFRHCALTAHFLILAALYYYFKNKGNFSFKAVIPFFIINALAITIHPYFLPFTFGIMFAYCLEGFILDKQYLKSAGYLLLSIVSTLFIGYIIGAFYVKGPLGAGGYGLFSMNLNGLHNPISRGFDNWSAVLEIKPHETYQIEGFNYLGLGIILFIPVCCIIYIFTYKKDVFRILFSFIKNYFGIIFSTACLFVFSIGDWVVFGGLRLFRLPIPDFLMNTICSVFRANGRFSWLLVYMIMLFVIFMISKLPVKWSEIAFCILLFIQIFDMRGVLSSKHAYFTGSEGDLQGQIFASSLKHPFWNDVAENHEVGITFLEIPGVKNIDFAVLFGKHHHAINANFEARTDNILYTEELNKITESFENGTLDEKNALFFDTFSDELLNAVTKNGYSMYKADGFYAVLTDLLSEEEINEYMNYPDFEVIA